MAPRPRRPPRIRPRTHIHRQRKAWFVKVRRRGQDFVGNFSDAVWGGRAPALLAAQRFRDELLQRIDADTRLRRQVPKARRSRTGVVGVTREPHVVGGRSYHRYVAAWQDHEKGRLVRRRFGVERYGDDGAKARAIDAREAGVARSHAYLLAHQREGATRRLREAAPMPRLVRDPLSRKGISMARRRPRRVK